jgi:hypothetical protein
MMGLNWEMGRLPKAKEFDHHQSSDMTRKPRRSLPNDGKCPGSTVSTGRVHSLYKDHLVFSVNSQGIPFIACKVAGLTNLQ